MTDLFIILLPLVLFVAASLWNDHRFDKRYDELSRKIGDQYGKGISSKRDR